MTSESNNKNDDTDNKWVQWIKDGIDNEYINYHDYNEFQDMECIGVGGFGNVYRANWKSSDTVVALKSLTNGKDSMKEVVNEIKLMHRINFHENIIQFFGITSNPKCWQENPGGRPEMQQIFSELKLVNVNTSELIEKCIKEKDIEYYGYNEFNKIEEIASGLVSKVYKAHWNERNGKCVALKLFNLKDDAIAKEAVHEIKLHREVDLSNVMIKLFGITKTDLEPSKQAVLVESGELNMSLYEGHPLVYTFINDRSSNTNLLSFNSDEDCVEFNESLQSSDICINFPVAEITYTADLSESYSNFMDDDVALYEMYGHIFSKRILIGGKLFIDGLKSATSRQIDLFVSFLTWAYDSARYRKENPFSNLSAMKFFPKITTLEEEGIDTPSKLINWINNLYQKNMASIISYRNLVPISELRFGTSSSTSSSNEKQPGVANFKGELSLEEWVKDYIYVNLARWIKELHLVQGLIISKHFELENYKKIAIDFINVPKVNSSDKSYLEFIKPTPTLEEFLAFNMSNEDMTLLPFIKKSAKSVDLSYCDYMHLMINCERYEILLNRGDIKASENFKQAIEEALESMKPHTSLQNVFDEYGYFFPLNIVLGKSLKNILPNPSSFTFEKSHLEIPLFESIKSHLDKLKIKYLLTKKGNVIEINDLYSWIQNTNDDLEIVKFDKIISLYDILPEKQKYKINIVLNNQDKLKIIMTGTVDLKDLDINNTEHFKRINVKPSLENGNYEVFGSIISKDKKENLKSDFFITFGLYDINGFSAMIKTLNVNNPKVNITECYILWMIIGKPSELSVFSPKNRKFLVYSIRESITLQPDNPYYSIKTSRQLSQEDTISVNVYCSSTNRGPMDVKFVGWSKSSISFQIIYKKLNLNISNSSTVITVDNDNDNDPLISIDIRISILSSKYKSLKIDNEENESYLDLIGYILSEENFNKESSSEDNPNIHIKKNTSFLNKDKGKKRDKEEDDQTMEHSPESPRLKLTRVNDLGFSPSFSSYLDMFDPNVPVNNQQLSNYPPEIFPPQNNNELNKLYEMGKDNFGSTRDKSKNVTYKLICVVGSLKIPRKMANLEKAGLKKQIRFSNDSYGQIRNEIEAAIPRLKNVEWMFYKCTSTASLVPADDVSVVDCRFDDLKRISNSRKKLYVGTKDGPMTLY
ncbi:hypothetical protein RhiirA4_448493 [Rhizophagus irregularis]|uniref:Protein kinase domain-containing protein n=1 Tax=Rhizophagus irregularis TaxID=588596 RepID=A0A2I1HA75_9GLOM|nr:hypothetical protein RhiirA4_448493 [Rhizophagus irregularis]